MRKMVTSSNWSEYHMVRIPRDKSSADVMLGTIWRIVRKRRIEEGDIVLLAPLTMKVVKTVKK